MPYFAPFLNGPVHGIFATDMLGTANLSPEDQGMEGMVNSRDALRFININTGECKGFCVSNKGCQIWGLRSRGYNH